MKRRPTKNRSRWGFSSEGIGRAIKISMTWVGLLWVVEIVDLSSGFQLDGYGILPRKVDGLMGVFWSPLLHADFAHLIAIRASGSSVDHAFLTRAIPTQVESRIHLVGKRPGNVAYRPSGHSHWCQFHCVRAGCFSDDGFILDEKLASLFSLNPGATHVWRAFLWAFPHPKRCFMGGTPQWGSCRGLGRMVDACSPCLTFLLSLKRACP